MFKIKLLPTLQDGEVGCLTDFSPLTPPSVNEGSGLLFNSPKDVKLTLKAKSASKQIINRVMPKIFVARSS